MKLRTRIALAVGLIVLIATVMSLSIHRAFERGNPVRPAWLLMAKV